uniref:hypothetical protein n=1 Tax=Pseudonocardia pini TaxID=2758030 RepID=UPI001C68E875
APLDAAVVDALGLDAVPRPHWEVNGTPVTAAEVRSAHLPWYADHPEWVEAGLARHVATLDLLGLRVRVAGTG